MSCLDSVEPLIDDVPVVTALNGRDSKVLAKVTHSIYRARPGPQP